MKKLTICSPQRYDLLKAHAEEKLEEAEAKGRQVFDPESKTFDASKRRVTDLDENTRVVLPKPANPTQEASIEIRRYIYI